MNMKKILVTGFEPFNGRDMNPSEQIVKCLTAPMDTVLVKRILPVEFLESGRILTETVRKESPDVILSIGQAGNAPDIAIEQVAVNIDSSLSADGRMKLPDQSGYAPVDKQILSDAPDAYFSTFPIRKLVTILRENEIPSRASFSAGTYVCNHVMYIGCHLAAQNKNLISGFVHVPFLPEQLAGESDVSGKYSMPLSQAQKGLQIIVNELAK